MRLYVANRGEIAARVLRTAKRLSIPTCVGFCEPDRKLPFVRLANRSFVIDVDSPRDAYLNIQKVIETAKKAEATHIHPGYGFLSENPEFVDAVLKEGLEFVGPRSESMRKLGDKIGSRLFLKGLGIPLLPSFEGDDQSLTRLKKEAERIGYPVLIKPSAGGGGKGMVIVRAEEEFEDGLASSKRVAASAFGDERVFIESFIEKARHIEVQILGDKHGNIVSLGERECSLQRRHQKLVEESPCIYLSDQLRRKVLKDSEKIAQAVNYESAGTVEWIWDGANGIYFLEVNARLQVEHPVTELVHSVDLVECQLRVAQSDSLDAMSFHEPTGHSIELRINAEDPQNEFLPTGGKIHRMSIPESARCDFGYIEGNTIGSEFDSLIGKLIVHADSRNECIQKLIHAIERLVVLGPTTNRSYLRQLIKSEEFLRGELYTSFLNKFRYHFDLKRSLKAIKELQKQESSSGGLGAYGEAEQDELDWYSPFGEIRRNTIFSFYEDFGDRRYYFFPFADWSEKRASKAKALGEAQASGDLSPEIVSPMPAKVIQLLVSDDEEVADGQVLMILEAMKMEHKIRAPFHAKVKELKTAQLEQVDMDQVLVVLEKLEKNES